MLNIALWYGGCRMMDGGHGGCVVMIVIVVKVEGQGGRPRWMVVTADGGNDCHNGQYARARLKSCHRGWCSR
jgi:hypothetical protein